MSVNHILSELISAGPNHCFGTLSGSEDLMLAHLKIAVGSLIAGIFLWRGIDAINQPGFGWQELYVLGGFVFAGLIIRSGWMDIKAKRNAQSGN